MKWENNHFQNNYLRQMSKRRYRLSKSADLFRRMVMFWSNSQNSRALVHLDHFLLIVYVSPPMSVKAIFFPFPYAEVKSLLNNWTLKSFVSLKENRERKECGRGVMVNHKIGSEILKIPLFRQWVNLISCRVILLTDEGLKVLFAE